MKKVTALLGFLGGKGGLVGILKDNDGKFAFKRALPILLITKVVVGSGFDGDISTNQLLVVLIAGLIYVGGKLADALAAKK